MKIHKQRMTMKASIVSEFWLLHIVIDVPVNKLHERALRIVYQDHASSFTELLEKDNSTTIHNRNIQLSATELFKFIKAGYFESNFSWESQLDTSPLPPSCIPLSFLHVLRRTYLTLYNC